MTLIKYLIMDRIKVWRVANKLLRGMSSKDFQSYKKDALPEGRDGRTLKKLLASGEGMRRREQKGLDNDPLLENVLNSLYREGWRVDRHPGLPFISFDKINSGWGLRIFITLPQESFKDYLSFTQHQEKLEFFRRFDNKELEMTLNRKSINPLENMIMQGQIESDRKEHESATLRRNDWPVHDFYAMLTKIPLTSSTTPHIENNSVGSKRPDLSETPPTSSTTPATPSTLILSGLSFDNTLCYEKLYYLPVENILPTLIEEYVKKGDVYSGPEYMSMNSVDIE